MDSVTPMLGTIAPNFSLPCVDIKDPARTQVSLEDYRGQWVILVFYPRDFSMVCPTELTGLSQRQKDFEELGCSILGISCDTLETHRRWLETPRSRGGLGGLNFPLASDIDGVVATSYRVFSPWQRVAQRGLFILDPNAVVQYKVVHSMSVGRRADEVLRVLAALQTGGLCAEDWTSDQSTLSPDRVIGPGSAISHFQIEQTIGRGSFATVFAAVDTKLDRRVALKVLRPESRSHSDILISEARAAASLNHPNICTIYSIDDDGIPTIAMELLEGHAISQRIGNVPLPEAQVLALARQIAEGMAEAHEHGVVHGDLKPDNLFLTNVGLLKILDFGLAKRRLAKDLNPQDAETVLLGESGNGQISGTPTYLAPELTLGEPSSFESDLFAFGVILLEMLTGRRVFDGQTIPLVFRQIRQVDPDALSEPYAEPVREILRSCLQPDPTHRSLSMRSIAKLLGGSLRDRPLIGQASF